MTATYVWASLRRCLHGGVQGLFDCPFLWQPPLHKLKGRVYSRLLGVQFLGEALICQDVRILEPANLEIGDLSYLAYGVRIEARQGVHIGSMTTISPEVFITTGDHSLLDLAPTNCPVWIGDGVFIGARAMILGGVRIGDNAVVGAGSVVTKDVPAGSIAAGIPARVIRQRDVVHRTWTVFGFRDGVDAQRASHR